MKVRPYASGNSLVAIESKVVTVSPSGDDTARDSTVTTTVVYLRPPEVEELIVRLHEQVAQAIKMDWKQ